MSAEKVFTLGSLFSGIGGLELGLEMTGRFQTVWQVEQNEYCRKVLARHWPNAQRFVDVREVGKENLPAVDVICGGFPCQDISYAGPGAGLAGERSGLWFEFARIIRDLGPRFVIVENVAALLDRGMGDVLGTLADCGYDAKWSRVTACSVGAPHMRPRVFIVAYANGLYGRPRIRYSASREGRSIPALNRFASARARWQARLANPSALYRNADGVPDGPQRNHAIGNAVAPDVGRVIGEWLCEIDRELSAAGAA